MTTNALGRQFLSTLGTRHQVPAHELMSGIGHFLDSVAYDNETQMWDQKLSQSIDRGVADSVAQEGVREPVTVGMERDGSVTMLDGHHRLATALAINPDMRVPVDFDDSYRGRKK